MVSLYDKMIYNSILSLIIKIKCKFFLKKIFLKHFLSYFDCILFATELNQLLSKCKILINMILLLHFMVVPLDLKCKSSLIQSHTLFCEDSRVADKGMEAVGINVMAECPQT